MTKGQECESVNCFEVVKDKWIEMLKKLIRLTLIAARALTIQLMACFTSTLGIKFSCT